MSRRRFLQGAAMAGGLGALGVAIPESIIRPAQATGNTVSSPASFVIENIPGTITAYSYINGVSNINQQPGEDAGAFINRVLATFNPNNPPYLTGGSIFLREGNYSLSTGIQISYSNITLKMSKGAVLKPLSGVTADVLTVNASDVILDSIGIDGSSGGGTGIRIGSTANSQRCVVYDCDLLNPGVHGVRLDYLTGVCFVYANRIQSLLAPTGSGILVQGYDHHVFENDVGGFGSTSPTGAGITCSNAGDVSIIGNQIYSNFVGIDLYLPAGIRIVGNNVQNNNQQGIRAYADTYGGPWGYVSIQDNIILDNGIHPTSPDYSAGIHITGNNEPMQEIIVSNNISTNRFGDNPTQNYGIRIDNPYANYLMITGNITVNNHIQGILRASSGSSYVIANNL